MKSKRGVALAYVIVVTAALLVLAAAFIALAQYNLNASQTTLESRQAYLDARSAIEFGKAYLAQNPDTESFTIVHSAKAGSGFAINKAGTQVAFYDSGTKQLSAKAPFKTVANHFRLLGYQFSGGGSGSGAPADYLICGTGYGTLRVFDNDINTLYVGINKKSDYPVVMSTVALRVSTDWNKARSLTAPEIYLMGQSSPEFYGGSYAAFHSNFVCFGGSLISGQDSRASFSDTTQPYSSLVLMTNPPGGTGVLCFTQNCSLQITGNQNARTVQIPKGYYSFHDGTDLYGLTSSNLKSLLTKLDSTALPTNVSTARVNFISSNYTSFLSGGLQDSNHGAIWTDDAGILANGHPSNTYSGHQYNLNSNIIYFYISSCENWESCFDQSNQNMGPNLNTAIYQSKQIYMRYVNSADDFTIPAGKTIIYQSNKIWMNTAKSDTSLGGDVPITAGNSGSQFVLKALSGSGSFELDVPAELTVNYKTLSGTAKSYRIKAGTYQLPQQINLFSDSASAALTASKSS